VVVVVEMREKVVVVGLPIVVIFWSILWPFYGMLLPIFFCDQNFEPIILQSFKNIYSNSLTDV